MSKLIPIGSFILLEVPANAKSLIIKPDNMDKKKLIEGASLLVTKVGPICAVVRPGDRIICDFTNAMMDFAFEGKQLFLTNEKNVCAIIRSDEGLKINPLK